MGDLLRRYTPDTWSMLAFLLPFALYLWCLAPSITFYDSGEFVTAVHFLGSAHSPGYPLFLLYAKPFTWLPLGNIAFRVNLATAVSAALACLAAYHLVLALLGQVPLTDDERFDRFTRQIAALSGSLLFAVSPRLWLQSNHDKPYPLLTALVGLMLIWLLRWQDQRNAGDEQPAYWYGVAFCAGLASGTHQTIVLLLPGFVLFTLVADPAGWRRLREWLLALSFLLLGGAVQLYLPLRAAAAARQNWGDASSLSRLLWHLLRRGYPEEPHSRSISLLLQQLGGFSIPREFSWIGLLLVLAGCWFCWQRQRPFFYLGLVSLFCFWLVIVGHFNPQPDAIFLTEEFYTPLYLLAAVLCSIGLYGLVAWGIRRARQPAALRLEHRALVAGLFCLVPLFQLARHLPAQDQHRNYLAQDYAVNSLRPLPEEGVLFTWGDSGAFPLWYLQGVERLREDLDLPHIPHLVFPWYWSELPRLRAQMQLLQGEPQAERQFARLVEQLQGQRPVLIDFSTRHSLRWIGPQPLQQGIAFLPLPGEEAADEAQLWQQYALHRLAPSGWLPDMDSEKALTIHAFSLMQSAEDLARRGHVREAEPLLQAAGSIMPAWQESLLQLRRRYRMPLPREVQP